MKVGEYQDEFGYNRKRAIKNEMLDTDAHFGVPIEPPDLSLIDWNAVEMEIHNLLMKRGVIELKTHTDLDLVRAAITKVVHPKIVALYKQQPDKEA